MLQLGLHCINLDGSSSPVSLVDLQSIDAQVHIRGFTANIVIQLNYRNVGEEAVEVAYKAPVDDDSAFYLFEADIDGRKITGHCIEKKKAVEIYKEAISSGNTAIIAAEDVNVGDLLHLKLGNLPPNSYANIKVGMVTELKVKTDGGVHFVLPTIFNPRYCPAEKVIEPTFSNMSSDAMEIYTSSKYSINIKCEVEGSKQITRVISHTDSINVNFNEDLTKAIIDQDGGYTFDHDWSVIVYYKEPYEPHVLVETGDRASTALMKDQLCMINLFPELPESSLSHRNEIIFVIDRSGSMRRDKIQSAKTALLLFLKSLPVGCMFNIVSFGSMHELLFKEGSVKCTENNLAIALNFQKTVEANMGGTEILGPLRDIYSKPCISGYGRQIMLITDGEVWNVDEVLNLISRHAHESRVFSVGIGHGASLALVKGIARAGGGRHEMVLQQDMLQTKVMGLMASMVQESVHNVSVQCDVTPSTGVTLIPRVPPVIFGGQHLILYARVPPNTNVSKVVVRGQIQDQDVKFEVQDGPNNSIKVIHDQHCTIHRLAAKAHIKQLQLDQEENVEEQVKALSLASGIGSRYTAFVGVDTDGKYTCNETDAQKEINSERSKSINSYSLNKLSTASFGRGGSMVPKSRKKKSLCRSSIGNRPRRYAAPSSARSEILEADNSELLSSAISPSFCLAKRQSNISSLSCSDEEVADCQASYDLTNNFLSTQHFNGSWTTDSVQKLIDSVMPSVKLDSSGKARYTSTHWATAVALVLLQEHFGHIKQQWTIIAEKAKNFLRNEKCDFEGIISEANIWVVEHTTNSSVKQLSNK